jgi:hypothetical protein
MQPDKQKNEDKTLGDLLKGIGTYINMALICATFFINYGMSKADNAQMQKRITDIEALKPEQMQWQIADHNTRIVANELDDRTTRDTINEMKIKIDVIAQWVAEQRRIATGR